MKITFDEVIGFLVVVTIIGGLGAAMFQLTSI